MMRLAMAGLASLAMAAAFQPSGAAAFERGINVSSVFTYPQEEGWPPFRGPRAQFGDDEMRALADAGFDFMRLPVDPAPFHTASPQDRDALIADVAYFVARANGAGLAVIVSGHPTHSDTAWQPMHDGDPARASFEDYAQWLETIARAVDDVAAPGGAAIALMNEPQPMCINEDGADWQDFQMTLHQRVRAVTGLPLVLTGGCWSQIEGLEELTAIPDDPHTLFDAHYYLPFAYTHQGATWATPILAYVGGLRFPPQDSNPQAIVEAVSVLVRERHEGSEEDRQARRVEAHAEIDRYLASGSWPGQLEDDFSRLSRWADQRGIERHRILVGEFGAIRPPHESQADLASRETYLRAVREAIEAQGFAWAMWEYLSPFGLTETDENRVLMPGVLDALGVKTTGNGG